MLITWGNGPSHYLDPQWQQAQKAPTIVPPSTTAQWDYWYTARVGLWQATPSGAPPAAGQGRHRLLTMRVGR
jgi:hypothetical protein